MRRYTEIKGKKERECILKTGSSSDFSKARTDDLCREDGLFSEKKIFQVTSCVLECVCAYAVIVTRSGFVRRETHNNKCSFTEEVKRIYIYCGITITGFRRSYKISEPNHPCVAVCRTPKIYRKITFLHVRIGAFTLTELELRATTRIDNADKRLLSIRHIIAALVPRGSSLSRVCSENSNYLYCRSDRKGLDYVTFSCWITPDACFSRFVSDSRIQLPFPEPLAGIRKERRQEEKGEEPAEEERRDRVFAGDSKVEMNCRHQQP